MAEPAMVPRTAFWNVVSMDDPLLVATGSDEQHALAVPSQECVRAYCLTQPHTGQHHCPEEAEVPRAGVVLVLAALVSGCVSTPPPATPTPTTEATASPAVGPGAAAATPAG